MRNGTVLTTTSDYDNYYDTSSPVFIRKIVRSKLMHDAKQYKGKTIAVFHYLWKKQVVEQREKVSGTITHTMQPTPQRKKKSALRRTWDMLRGVR